MSVIGTVMRPDPGMEVNIRKPLAAEVVSDCSPGTSGKPEDDNLSKEPEEHRENGKAMLYTEEPPADKITGLCQPVFHV